MLIGASEGLSNSKATKEIQSKYYLNTSASLIHRSISEMVEFVSYYGGKAETVYGLATGEAQAHLRYLHFAGRIKCEIRDGVGWYHAA